jgi:mRNA-degrading endonuclease RelE of RelBE toxin-antitoxin system
MNFNVEIITTPYFFKEAKALKKRYRSLNEDLASLDAELTENPYLGTLLGDDTYKIRLAIHSKNKGKSGGARVITYVVAQEKDAAGNDKIVVYLLSIYDKSDATNISTKAVAELVKAVREVYLDLNNEQ